MLPKPNPAGNQHRSTIKRLRRKEFVSSNHKPYQHPYSRRETLLRTDYKDTGAPSALSNDGY